MGFVWTDKRLIVQEVFVGSGTGLLNLNSYSLGSHALVNGGHACVNTDVLLTEEYLQNGNCSEAKELRGMIFFCVSAQYIIWIGKVSGF